MRLRGVVARNLRRLRQAKGLSQEELAARAEINRNYVSLLEREENAASVDMLEKLADVLGVDPAAFPNLCAHYDRMMERQAVRKTITAEAALGYTLPA